MQGKKELLSKLMYRSQLLRLFKEVRRDMLVIFGWHRVLPDGPREVSPYADDVFGPTASELEEALVWLARNVRVISEPELIGLVESGKSAGELSVMITFDDGYADNYTLAYPILARHHIPAVFFVPSKRIEERDLGWVDLIPYAIKKTNKDALEWSGRRWSLPREGGDAIAHLHKVMQLERQDATKNLVAELAARLEVELPARDVQTKELMTWDQVREVSKNGIAIGSHTHSHRVLATLPAEEQKEELARSKALIEERIGSTVRTIAYPVGGYRHFGEDTKRIAKECGYTLGYSYCTGTNRFGNIARFDVKRIGPPLSVSMLAGTTVLPEVFDWDQTAAYGGR